MCITISFVFNMRFANEMDKAREYERGGSKQREHECNMILTSRLRHYNMDSYNISCGFQ